MITGLNERRVQGETNSLRPGQAEAKPQLIDWAIGQGMA
jgi:hypothetical protein